ncbi:MAG: dipeptide ABC transporter ATP-binding protein [Geminicoccaceae bacterium]
MSFLEIDRLSVAINGETILEEVGLAIAPGERVALVGESGSGKSMTAFSIMGLLPRFAERSGRILFRSQDLTAMDDRALCRLRGAEIGMVFQEPATALNPALRIGDQVAEAFRLHGRDARAENVLAVLARVGLDPADVPPTRYPHQLSGGQRQRVGIAMAIACGPKLLIADEPTTALDVTTQSRILQLLDRLIAEEDMSLLLITHDLGVVAQMAERCLVMDRGRVIEQKSTAELFQEPDMPRTKALFDALPGRTFREDARPQEASPALAASAVAYSYPGERRGLWRRERRFAVDHVSLQVEPGHCLGLVGSSGCGKSTLARLLVGLNVPEKGRITLKGSDLVAELAASTKRVRAALQMVFQDPYGSLDPRHLAGRIVTEPLRLRPELWADRLTLCGQMLEAVGLQPGDAAKYPHEFSGGQRQRIAIARALITSPQVLIADEAVSALDVTVQAQILRLLITLQRDFDLAMIFISHNLAVVHDIAHEVAVMADGRIVEQAPTERLFREPNHEVTAELLAAVPSYRPRFR